MKTTIIAVVVLILIGIGAYAFTRGLGDSEVAVPEQAAETNTGMDEDAAMEEGGATVDGSAEDMGLGEGPADEGGNNEPTTELGTSVEGTPIVAYHFGTGDTELLFVGGIHGGYSWNTALVAYDLIDYLTENKDVIPEGVKVTVIPVVNPDGLKKVVGTAGRFEESMVPATLADRVPGRFNAHNVDLNRNFACDWQAEGTWQSKSVSGGNAAFSEPESQALKNYVEKNTPAAVVVWYAAAGGVYASNCHNGVLPKTTEIMNVYAQASGYPAHQTFDYYEVTGDMVNWLASKNIPGISVLLTTHDSVEWDKNKKGIDALLAAYAE